MSKETSEIIPLTQTNLYIDVGNSSIKAAEHDGEWSKVKRFAHDEISPFLDWMKAKAGSTGGIVLSSVVEETTKAIVEHNRDLDFIILEINDLARELLNYDTPETLGIDRYLACYGALALWNNSVVVIDAGSACTIDYMSTDGVFHGGVIMPGISAVEMAVKLHAPALPGVSRSIPAEWPGKSTQASLQWGLTGAFADSIQAALLRYREVFGSFDLVLTGGDAEWISSLIEMDHRIEPMVVFEGMKRFVESMKSD